MSYWIDKGIDGFYLSGIEYLARMKSGSIAVCLCISRFQMPCLGKETVLEKIEALTYLILCFRFLYPKFNAFIVKWIVYLGLATYTGYPS